MEKLSKKEIELLQKVNPSVLLEIADKSEWEKAQLKRWARTGNVKYYARNKAKIIQKQKQYYYKNRKTLNKKRYAKFKLRLKTEPGLREKYNEKQAEYYHKNKGIINELKRGYYRKNREKILQKQKTTYKKDKVRRLKTQRKYYKKNKNKILGKMRQTYWRKKKWK